MGILKKNKEAKPDKPKKGKKGVLDAIGVKAENLPSEEQQKQHELDQKLIQVWIYLRKKINKGIHEYYRQGGDLTVLEQHMKRPAIDAAADHLKSLRAQRIYLEPTTEDRAQARYEIVPGSVKKTDGKPTEFVIRERFKDFTAFKFANSNDPSTWTLINQCDGKERVIEATVMILANTDYRVRSIAIVEE